MKTLNLKQVEEVSGGMKFDGCSWLSPVDSISSGASIGGGVGAAWGAAAGLAGFAGYNLGVAINRGFGRCR